MDADTHGRTSRSNPRLIVFLSTGITGLTNIALPLCIQVTGDLTVLGQFAVASIPQAVALAISRSLGSQTVLRGSRCRDVKNFFVVFGLVLTGSLVATVLLASWLRLPPSLWALALAAPLSVVQDLFRQRVFGAGLATRALASDVIWLVSFVLVLLVALGTDVVAVGWVVPAYTVGALVAVIYAAATWPTAGSTAFGQVSAWPLMAEASAIYGLAQISQLVVAASVPLAVIGTFRSAMTALAPLGLLIAFAQSVSIPKLDVRRRQDVHRWALRLFVLSWSGALVISLSFALAPTAVTDPLGFETNASFLATLLVAGFGISIGGLVSIHLVRLRVLWPTREWLAARVVIACIEPLFTIPLTLIVGAAGLASNMTTTNGLLLAYAQMTRRRTRPPADSVPARRS